MSFLKLNISPRLFDCFLNFPLAFKENINILNNFEWFKQTVFLLDLVSTYEDNWGDFFLIIVYLYSICLKSFSFFVSLSIFFRFKHEIQFHLILYSIRQPLPLSFVALVICVSIQSFLSYHFHRFSLMVLSFESAIQFSVRFFFLLLFFFNQIEKILFCIFFSDRINWIWLGFTKALPIAANIHIFGYSHNGFWFWFILY